MGAHGDTYKESVEGTELAATDYIIAHYSNKGDLQIIRY